MTHFRLRWAQRGSHVHVSVWSAAGEASTHARNGQLILSLEEWADFKDLLQGAHPVLAEFVEGGDSA